MRTAALAVLLVLCSCDAIRDLADEQVVSTAYAANPVFDTTGVIYRRVLRDAEEELGVNTNANDVSILPDGSGAVLIDWDLGELALLDFQTKTLHHLTHENGAERFSRGEPDGAGTAAIRGRQVVFGWHVYEDADGPTNRMQLHVLSLDGGEPRVILDVGGDWVEPRAWSPDGRTVVAILWGGDSASGAGQIIIVPASGGEPRVVRSLHWPHSNADVLTFTPDGRYLVYDDRPAPDAPRDIFVADVETGRERRVVQSPWDDQLVAWVPGSDRILFLSDRTGTTGLWSLQLRNGEAIAAPVLVRPDMWRAAPQGITDDGRAFFSVQVGGQSVVTTSLDRDSGMLSNPRVLLSDAASDTPIQIGFSPDGASVSYTFLSNRRWFLGVRSLAGAETREYTLPISLQAVTLHSWLPDGSAILLSPRMAGDPAPFQRRRLERIDLATGAFSEIDATTDDEDVFTGALYPVPGERQAVLIRPHIPAGANHATFNTFYLRDLSTGAEHELARAQSVRAPVASPDGSRVALLFGSDPDHLELSIRSLVDGGASRVLARFGPNPPSGRIFWAPDGQSIVKVEASEDRDAWGLTWYPVDGGPVVRTPLVFPEGVEPPAAGNLVRFSPTEDRVAFPTGGVSNELWVVEGLAGGADTRGAR